MKKKVFSKSMAWLLSVVMVFGLYIIAPIVYADAITQSEFDSKLNQLRLQYPNYSTWNDYFDGGHQCWGFARLIAYNVFGSHADNWSKSTSINEVKAGDVLQYGNTSGSGHTVFVTSVSGNTITFVDCNGNGNYSNGSKVRSCGIKWDNTISKSQAMFSKYAFSYRLVAPDIQGGGTIVNPPTPSPDDTNIKSSIDGVDGGAGSIRIYGWAFDGDITSQSIYVAVYIGGDSGSADAEGHRILANKTRPDVNAAFGCGDNHGIDETITTSKRGNQTVYIYGINVGAGSDNPLIAVKNVTISEPSSSGNDTTPPTISNPLIKDLSRDGYTLICTVSDNVGVTRVMFPTWTISNDQDDLIWHEGTVSGNIASIYIKASDHKNETGPYITDIYAYDAAGNSVSERIPDISLIPFVISYNMNGGSGSIPNQSKIYGDTLTLSSTVPTRANYQFIGWSTSKNASTAQYQAGGKYTANKDATLYAVWKSNTYTISYNMNGAVGSIANQTKTYGVDLTLSSTKPERKGYEFVGWNTDSSVATAQYQPGGKYTANSSATLYAIWKKKVVTVVFHRNADSNDTITKSAGYTYAVNGQAFSDNGWTRTGYTLDGWSKSPDAKPSDTKVAADASATATSVYQVNAFVWNEWMLNNYPTVDLYAVWKEKVITVVFHRNTDSDDTVTQSAEYTYGVNGQDFSDNGWTRAGYTLLGWSTTSKATAPDYSVHSTVGNNWIESNYPTKHLFAVWKENTYTVTYDMNGGSGTIAEQIKNYGQALTLDSTAPARTGYEFEGWSTDAGGTTVQYQPGDTYTVDANLILYAVWKEKPAAIPGDINNDGKVNMKDATRLHQYINGWEVPVVEAALDVNGDGKVNMKDVTRLHQYINGWDVKIYVK